MRDNCDILILTARFGTGHISVSNALKEHIHDKNNQMRIDIVDLYEVMHPTLHKSMYKSYELLIRLLPYFYNRYYYGKEEYALIQKLDTTSHYSIKLLSELIDQKKPKAIISTFPSCTSYVARYKKEYKCNIPLITCITDVVDNNEWLYKENDLYFVANAVIKDALISKGIQKEKILVTGIPIRKKFLKSQKEGYIRKQLGYLPEDKIILLMGGGLGILPKNKEFYKWLNNLDKVKVVVLTSKNKSLYRKLLEINGSNIRIFEYCNNVYEYMKVADIFIGKSGGITLFEAIASKLPIIVYKPILGQEIENSNFIINHKIGYVAYNIEQLKKLIIKSLNKTENERLVYNIKKLKDTIDMERISEEVLKYILLDN